MSIGAAVLSLIVVGAGVAAAPYVDRSTIARGLFQALTAASGRQIAPATLNHVPKPGEDRRTKALWRHVGSVATMRDAWVMQDGIVIRGSTRDHAPFYLIARKLQGSAAAATGILLPDDAGAAPMTLRSFRSPAASFELLYGESMSRADQTRVMSMAIGAGP